MQKEVIALPALSLFFLIACSSGTAPDHSGTPFSDDNSTGSSLGATSLPTQSSDGASSAGGETPLSSNTGTSSSAANPNTNIKDLLTEAQFHQIFPITDPNSSIGGEMRTACASQSKCRSVSTYQGLVDAAGHFSDFVSIGTLDDRKRELAAFFANVGKETTGGWDAAPGGYEAWGLCYCEELGGQGYTESSDPNYQAVTGKSYHGRGALQISYPYNYGPVSEFLYNDKTVLLNNPEKILDDPMAFWGGSLWFWTIKEDVAPGETPPNGTPGAKGFNGKYYKPSCHMAMTGSWTPRQSDIDKKRTYGLGVTINVINGGLECAWGWDSRGQGRVKNYKKFCEILGVAPVPPSWSGSADDFYECKNQTSFTTP